MGIENEATENDLVALVGPFWSAERTRGALVFESAETLEVARAGGAVLGVPSDSGDVFYPLWQFQRVGARVSVIHELVPILTSLRHHDPWAVAVLLRTPAPELDGETPLERARAGDSAALRELALVVDREWSQGSCQ